MIDNVFFDASEEHVIHLRRQKYVEKCLIDGVKEDASDPNGIEIGEIHSNEKLVRAAVNVIYCMPRSSRSASCWDG